jgi:hypothetical protein
MESQQSEVENFLSCQKRESHAAVDEYNEALTEIADTASLIRQAGRAARARNLQMRTIPPVPLLISPLQLPAAQATQWRRQRPG